MYELFFIIMCIVIAEAIAQYFIKKYTELPRSIYFILGICFYAVVVFFLQKSYLYANMGLANVLWSGLSVISILTVGSLVFGDKITLNEWIGMIVILCGVILTQMNTEKITTLLTFIK